MQIVRDRHAKYKTSGLRTRDQVKLYPFELLLHKVYGKRKSVCILQDAGYITEYNSRLRKIRNTSYVLFDLFHNNLSIPILKYFF